MLQARRCGRLVVVVLVIGNSTRWSYRGSEWYRRGLLQSRKSEKSKLEKWFCRSKGDGRCGGVIPQKVVSAV